LFIYLNSLCSLQRLANQARDQYIDFKRAKKARAILRGYYYVHTHISLDGHSATETASLVAWARVFFVADVISLKSFWTMRHSTRKCLRTSREITLTSSKSKENSYYSFFSCREVSEKRLKGVPIDLFGPIDPVLTLARQFQDMLNVIYEEDWPNFSKYYLPIINSPLLF
jgi:hypothetical protein